MLGWAKLGVVFQLAMGIESIVSEQGLGNRC